MLIEWLKKFLLMYLVALSCLLLSVALWNMFSPNRMTWLDGWDIFGALASFVFIIMFAGEIQEECEEKYDKR